MTTDKQHAYHQRRSAAAMARQEQARLARVQRTAASKSEREKRRAEIKAGIVAGQLAEDNRLIRVAREFGGDITSAQLDRDPPLKSAMLRARRRGAFNYNKDEGRYVLLDAGALA